MGKCGCKYMKNICLLVGATALGEPYNQSPPGVRFLNKIIFYRTGLLAPRQTPILEDHEEYLKPLKWKIKAL
jgi:hypothetical protein